MLCCKSVPVHRGEPGTPREERARALLLPSGYHSKVWQKNYLEGERGPSSPTCSGLEKVHDHEDRDRLQGHGCAFHQARHEAHLAHQDASSTRHEDRHHLRSLYYPGAKTEDRDEGRNVHGNADRVQNRQQASQEGQDGT